ncbi:MAG: biotin/lipoyl-binding protein [Burkholderiaceae bacterium]
MWVQITPQAGGTVIDILADDTDRVKAGQVLLRFDPTDARLALEQAKAQLAQTVRCADALCQQQYARCADRAARGRVAARA